MPSNKTTPASAPSDVSSDQPTDSKRYTLSSLEEGIALVRAGDRAGARAIFLRMIHSDPYQEDAWLWLAWVAESKAQSLTYLKEAQALLPESDRVVEALTWAQQQFAQEAQAAPAETASCATPLSETQAEPAAPPELTTQVKRTVRETLGAVRAVQRNAAEAVEELKTKANALHLPAARIGRWRAMLAPFFSFLVIVSLAALVMLGIANARSHTPVVQALVLPTPSDAPATPTINQRTEPLWAQVDVALTRQDWNGAISALQRVREIDPRNEEARKRLAEAYYGRGVELIKANKLDQAQADLDAAVRLDAGNEALQELRRQTRMYLDGLEAYWVHDWANVVGNLQRVYQLNPDFRDTHVMLGQAYYELGKQLQEAERWEEAKQAFEQVTVLLPDLADAQERLKQVNDIIVPPKRIEVDLSEQYVIAYEDNKPKYTFPVCTGRATAPTVPGRYQILDKLPSAYGSKWNIDMPWWMGIYWAGGSENGFHALPVLSNGQVIWGDRLGRPCSYGCIVLDTEDAITLYNWAEIGTVVFVSP